jgi:hypothetical protein
MDLQGNSDPIHVTVIRRKGAAALVEYHDYESNPVRVSVLEESIELSPDGTEGMIDPQDLSRGIEYGIPWEFRLRTKQMTSQEMSNALHRNGIWTSDDVTRKPDAVRGALLEVLRQTLSDINQIAKEFGSKET